MQPKSIDRIPEGIQIQWQDGHVSSYTAEFLRRKCPCAVCKGIPEVKSTNVSIRGAKQMGWYALQFTFSDQHDTGIYSYEILRKICPCEKCRLNSGS